MTQAAATRRCQQALKRQWVLECDGVVAAPIEAQNEGADTHLRHPHCIISIICSALFRSISCMNVANLISFQGRTGQDSHAAYRDLRFYLHERLTSRREGDFDVRIRLHVEYALQHKEFGMPISAQSPIRCHDFTGGHNHEG